MLEILSFSIVASNLLIKPYINAWTVVVRGGSLCQ
jgi:hypothetical protein